ncbi:hypothetical protein CRG98_004926 [Punica granatum]|uniref:Uncharacterized protein n=1 Tax=Punica granatum TaxID=22663 RepID=A0A2I0L1M5_PUNGR|nr:hypothetical protein CRG98_004926 [Punica granatum]
MGIGWEVGRFSLTVGPLGAVISEVIRRPRLPLAKSRHQRSYGWVPSLSLSLPALAGPRGAHSKLYMAD